MDWYTLEVDEKVVAEGSTLESALIFFIESLGYNVEEIEEDTTENSSGE